MPKRKLEPKTNEDIKKKKSIDNKSLDDDLIEIDNAICNTLPQDVNLTDRLIKRVINENEDRFGIVFTRIYSMLCKYTNKNVKIIALLKQKIDRINVEELFNCSILFIEQLKLINDNPSSRIEKNFLNFSIALLNRIQLLKEDIDINNRFSELLANLFEIKLNENLVFEFYKIFKEIKLTTEKSSELLYRAFNESEIKWKPSKLSEFFQNTFSFVSIYKSNASFVFESIITFFHNLNTLNQHYLENKSYYIEAEINAVEYFVKYIKSDENASIEFIDSLKSVLNANLKDKYLSRFVVALVLNLSQTIHRSQRNNLTHLLIKTVEELFEINENYQTHKWMKNLIIKSTKEKLLIDKNLKNIFEFNRVNELVDETIAYKSLIEFSLHLLDLYSVHVNLTTKIFTARQAITFFATNILLDLFLNCNNSRELVLKSLFNSIELAVNNEMIDLNHTTYFDQLDIIMINLKKYNDDNDEKLQKFIFKYFMKNIFALNSLCVVKLFNIFHIYFKFNCVYVKNLVDLLKKSVNDENLDTRKASIYGLVNLSKSLIFSQSDLSEAELEYVLSIFNLVQDRMFIENDFEIKSYIYQLFCKIASHNNLTIMEKILEFFVNKIKEYLIINSTQTFIRLDKCLSYDIFKLMEPIDLLLHCAFTCKLNYTNKIKETPSTSMLPKYLKILDTYLQSLTDTLIGNDSKYIFQIYKQQIEDKYKIEKIALSNAIKIQHQLQLGLIDVLIEYKYFDKSYNTIMKLLKKYDEMSNLISVEIEDFMSPMMTPKSLTRKPANDTLSMKSRQISKKYRSFGDENNKENKETPQHQSTPKLSLLSANLKITQHTPPLTPSKHKTNIQNISFANIKFDHTHRVSYTSLLNMLKTCLSCGYNQNSNELINSDKLNSILDLIIDDNFIDYLIQIVETKLNELRKQCNTQTVQQSYDPELYNSSELNEFLLSLFEIFWQIVHGVNKNGTRLSHPEIVGRYSAVHLNRILKYLKILQNIWSIIFKEYSDIKLNKVFKRDGDAMRQILKDCTDSFSNYNQTQEQNLSISIKIRSAILEQIFEITSKFEIENSVLELLFTWLLERCGSSYAAHAEIGKNLMSLVFHLSDLIYTPAIYVKYFLIDFECFSGEASNDIYYNTIDANIVKQYSLFTKENCFEHFISLMNEQENVIYLLEWLLTNTTQFKDNFSLDNFYIILHNVIWSAYYSLRSIYNTQTIRLTLDTLAMLYSFMINLLKHYETYGLKYEEKYKLKEVITMIATNLQATLSDSFNRIQAYMFNQEQQREGKADANEIKNILRNKHAINNLINCIEEFEEELQYFNENFKDINFMESYTKFISNIQIKFYSRVTRTISEQQINKIINLQNENENLI